MIAQNAIYFVKFIQLYINGFFDSLLERLRIPSITTDSAINVVNNRMVKMSANTRYVFVQTPRRRNPAVVAYTATQVSENEISIQFGVSFCHRKDNFNRALGREIATGRLQRRPLTHTIPFGPDQKFGVAVTEAVRNLVSSNHTQFSSFYGRAAEPVQSSFCYNTGVLASLSGEIVEAVEVTG